MNDYRSAKHLIICFVSVFPFIIDPWNEDLTFTLIKSTFLIGFTIIVWLIVWKHKLLHGGKIDGVLEIENVKVYLIVIFALKAGDGGQKILFAC